MSPALLHLVLCAAALQACPPGAGPACLFTITGHTGDVLSVAFSPDGETLVTGSADATARVWNATTGEQIAALQHTVPHPVPGVAFSPGGSQLLTACGDSTARLWDTDTWAPLQIISLPAPAASAAFAPDGSSFAIGCADSTLQTYTTAGTPVLTLQHNPSNTAPFVGGAAVLQVPFSPNGSSIASASSNGTALWDAETGALLLAAPSADAVADIAFSPDGSHLLVAAGDAVTQLLLLRGGDEGVNVSHGSTVRCTAYAPTAQHIATGSADATTLLWDAASGEAVAVLRGAARDPVLSLAFSPDASQLATAQGPAVVLWHAGPLPPTSTALPALSPAATRSPPTYAPLTEKPIGGQATRLPIVAVSGAPLAGGDKGVPPPTSLDTPAPTAPELADVENLHILLGMVGAMAGVGLLLVCFGVWRARRAAKDRPCFDGCAEELASMGASDLGEPPKSVQAEEVDTAGCAPASNPPGEGEGNGLEEEEEGARGEGALLA